MDSNELELEYNKNREYNFDYRNGWVLPNGLFYGVDFATHDIVCENHFNINIKEAEKLGWIRITQQQPFFQCLKNYTEKQIKTIIDYYMYNEAYYALKFFLDEVKKQESYI